MCVNADWLGYPRDFTLQWSILLQEIDGAAFLLLNSNNIVKYMQLKLGPALKLTSVVEDLKQTISRKSKRKWLKK